jgi:Negative regulator of sigma F
VSDIVDVLGGARPPKAPPMSAALEAELGKLTAVKPRRPMRELGVMVVLSLLYGAGLVVMFSVRGDLRELPMPWLVAAGLAWLLGFVVPCYLALVPPRGSMQPRWRLAAACAVVASIGFVVLGLFVHPSGAHSKYIGWEHLPRGHGCLELGVASALVPVVIGALFLRRALPVGARWVAAALGAGGGCLGGLVLHLHCPVTDAPHVGLVHGGVVIVSALLSAALVTRTTEP